MDNCEQSHTGSSGKSVHVVVVDEENEAGSQRHPQGSGPKSLIPPNKITMPGRAPRSNTREQQQQQRGSPTGRTINAADWGMGSSPQEIDRDLERRRIQERRFSATLGEDNANNPLGAGLGDLDTSRPGSPVESNTSQDPLACPSNDKHANSTQVIGPHRSYSGDKFTSAAHGASTVQEEYLSLLERFNSSYVSVWAAKHHVIPAPTAVISQGCLMLGALALLAAATETGTAHWMETGWNGLGTVSVTTVWIYAAVISALIAFFGGVVMYKYDSLLAARIQYRRDGTRWGTIKPTEASTFARGMALFTDTLSFFAAVVWSKALVDSVGGASMWLYVGGAVLVSLSLSIGLSSSVEGGPSWTWQGQESTRTLQMFLVSSFSWMCALGWASASHRSLDQLANTGDPIAVMSAWGTTACTLMSAVILLTQSNRHAVRLLPDTNEESDCTPLLGASGAPLESSVMHGEVFYLFEMLVRKGIVWTSMTTLFQAVMITFQVFEGRTFRENPSSNNLLMFAVFATGCAAFFVGGLEQIARDANRRLYNSASLVDLNGHSDSQSNVPAPSSFALAVARYSSRVEHLERTNDLVEAGIKGTAYLLALSWDRAIVSLIFDRHGGRLSDLWGYAICAIVMAGLATLYAVTHLKSHPHRSRETLKSVTMTQLSQSDIIEGEL